MTTTDNRELCGLAAAARLCLDEDVAAFDAPEAKNAAISRKETARILRSIRASGARRSGRFGKAAACFLLVFSLLFAGAMCIEPIRAAVLHAILNFYEDCIHVWIAAPETETPDRILEVLLPDVPNDWTAEEIVCDDTDVIYIYHTPDGQHASFQQMPWSDSAVIALDNTDCTVQEIRLNRRLTAQLFAYTDGRYALVWENRYTFIADGTNIDLDLLLSMANSVNDKVEQLSAKK